MPNLDNTDNRESVLVLFGSPRKNGNTRKLVDAFIESRNLNAEYIFVNNLDIKGCIGCQYCQSHNGECKLKDDMTGLYSTIKDSRKIIIAFPIYYGSIPGKFKCMIDRLFAVSKINQIDGKNLYGSVWDDSRDIFLIVSHGNSIPQVLESVERVIKYVCVDTNSTFNCSYYSKPFDHFDINTDKTFIEDLIKIGNKF